MSYNTDSIFREYDIRGIADQDFSEDFAHQLGQAIATLLLEKNEWVIAVGRDCRLTSQKYAHALIKGIIKTGVNVINLGVCPTPLVYFSVFEHDICNGIQVTGSHNAADYNGFKISVLKESFYGKQIQDLKERIDKKVFVTAPKKGTITNLDIIDSYSKYMVDAFSFKNPSKIVVDCGNGVGGNVAPNIFRKLGCEVTELYCDLDGTFPNHHPDPTAEKNMQDLIAKVKEENAQFGIAFDGDADRIGVVDHTGEILWGDRLMILYAQQILKKHPGAAIIGEVKCSRELYKQVQKLGGRPIMWKTGHSLIKAKIKEEKALLAGEMSGHMFFADRYFGYDDAIYAALRLIEIVSETGKTIPELLSGVEQTYCTPEIRVDCPDNVKFDFVEKTKKYFQSKYKTNNIDGVRVEFDDGWGLIRASNTQPVLVLRFEATSQKRLLEIKEIVEDQLKTL